MFKPKYIIAACQSEDSKGKFIQIVKLRPYTAIKFDHNLYNGGKEIKDIPDIQFAFSDRGAERKIKKMKKEFSTNYVLSRFD